MHKLGYHSCPTDPTYGSRSKQTGRVINIIPLASVTWTTCWWLTITPSMWWTRWTASSYENWHHQSLWDVPQGKLKKKTFKDGTLAWGLYLVKYVQQSVKNVEMYITKYLDGRYALPKVAENPFQCDYIPKEDMSPLLEPSMAMLICHWLASCNGWVSSGRSPCAPRFQCCHHSLQCCVKETWRHYMCLAIWSERATPGSSFQCCPHFPQCCVKNTWRKHYMCLSILSQRETLGSSLIQWNPVWEILILSRWLVWLLCRCTGG